MTTTLYYVHDPMCSWCWAFRPALAQLLAQLPEGIRVEKLLGGLAPDSDTPMSAAMQERLQQTWQRIEQSVPGTRFNFDFWTRNTPRRATYPACRAMIAAREQGKEEAMLTAIQRAYYQQARNPSDTSTLLELAVEIGLDREVFARALSSPQTQIQLEREMARAEALGVDSYPSLVLAVNGSHWPVPVEYSGAEKMLDTIEWLLGESTAGG
jgi:putative protein-disulfide isomerase